MLDLVNFGMAVVIWMVQIIIYPGFRHYEPARLIRWHARYTTLISWIVVPLMLTQLILLGRSAYVGGGPAVSGMLAMVVLCWGWTFKYSVALHRRISRNQDVADSVRMLVWTNWPRTILWSAVFLLGLFLDGADPGFATAVTDLLPPA
jgi:hypothetical protein